MDYNHPRFCCLLYRTCFIALLRLTIRKFHHLIKELYYKYRYNFQNKKYFLFFIVIYFFNHKAI